MKPHVWICSEFPEEGAAEAIIASETEVSTDVADNDQSSTEEDSEGSTADDPEQLAVTRTLIYEDCSEGVAALAAAIAAAPLLRRRVWLHDNNVGKEHLEAAARMLQGIEELCL
eukprot:COSAG02_NODE_3567_length_6548_cov_23.648007_6_plen_114_part_00